MTDPFPAVLDGEDKTCPLKNRIRKNYKHIRKWAKNTNTTAFRIYDRDIKEYPITIDFYEGHFSVHYFADARDDKETLRSLSDFILNTLHSLFGTASDRVEFRVRIKRDKTEQYEKEADLGRFFPVTEYGVKFYVNLTDYLDTGLFLDHRETRRIVARRCRGKSLLNLFAYTCSFSVAAAAEGALSTRSVDLSNTYTEWGKRNFLLNGLSLKKNLVIREDCLKFLEREPVSGRRYDVIVIDPPTVSRSKKMDRFFDVAEDYVDLILAALPLLAENGALFFSTNSRKFVFDATRFSGVLVEEISEKTIPFDFHNRKIHKCWVLSKCQVSRG